VHFFSMLSLAASFVRSRRTLILRRRLFLPVVPPISLTPDASVIGSSRCEILLCLAVISLPRSSPLHIPRSPRGIPTGLFPWNVASVPPIRGYPPLRPSSRASSSRFRFFCPRACAREMFGRIDAVRRRCKRRETCAGFSCV